MDPDRRENASTTVVSPAQDSAEDTNGHLWRNANFLKFWFGETVSLFGVQVTYIALPLTAVLYLGASAGQVGLIRFLEFLPYALFGLLFGVWVDRHRRRSVLLVANFSRMILIGMIPILAAAGHLTFAILSTLTFCVGTMSVLFDVTWMSYVPTLVGERKYLVDANSKLSATSSAADVAGPSVGGVAAGAMTAPTSMAVNSATYLVSLISLLLIRVEEKPPARPARRHLGAELIEGLRWVLGNPYLRAAAWVGGSLNFVSSGTIALFILYGIRGTHLQPGVVGLILSTGAVGGLLGTLSVRKVVGFLGIGRTYLNVLSGAFLAPLLIPAAAGQRWLVITMFIASFFLRNVGIGVGNVLMVTLRQTVTPDRLLGRMNATMRTAMYGLAALGAAAAGIAGSVFGLRTALWLFAVGAAACVIPLLFSPIIRLKELPVAAEEAPSRPTDSVSA